MKIMTGCFLFILLSSCSSYETLHIIGYPDFTPSIFSKKITFEVESDSVICNYGDSLKFDVVFRNVSQDTVNIVPEGLMNIFPCDSIYYMATDLLEWNFALNLTPINNLTTAVTLFPGESYIYNVKTLEYMKYLYKTYNSCVYIHYTNHIQSYAGITYEIGEFRSKKIFMAFR